MASDLIYREDAKDFVRHAYNKGLNPVEYLDEIPAADFTPTAPVVKGVEEAIALLNAINGEGRLDYAAYSELHDVITCILPEEEANK